MLWQNTEITIHKGFLSYLNADNLLVRQNCFCPKKHIARTTEGIEFLLDKVFEERWKPPYCVIHLEQQDQLLVGCTIRTRCIIPACEVDVTEGKGDILRVDVISDGEDDKVLIHRVKTFELVDERVVYHAYVNGNCHAVEASNVKEMWVS